MGDHLKQELNDKLNEIQDLNMDLSILKEKINMMKGTLGDKIEETANLSGKIHRAEKKFGARLSQVDLSSVQKQLKAESEQSNGMNIPDYGQSNNKKTKHRKQRSSTTIALDQLNDDFSDIARNVSSYGSKQKNVSGPTHYRKFSNTTKMIIGDIVDEDGIDFDDDDNDQRLERQSNDEKEEEPKRKEKTRASRESRQLNDDEIDDAMHMNEDEEIKERQSNEENEDENDTNHSIKKRPKKSRQSRESRQLNEHEMGYSNMMGDVGSKRQKKSRQSRESRQINETDIGIEEFEIINDDALGNNMQIDSAQKQVKRNKARGSVQMESAVLSSAALETHNEHHLEEVAAQINGPKDMIKKHKKSDTMTSDSSAYRAFMSVD